MVRRTEEDNQGRRKTVPPETTRGTLEKMIDGIARAGETAVVADSYFTTLEAANALAARGLKFALATRRRAAPEVFDAIQPADEKTVGAATLKCVPAVAIQAKDFDDITAAVDPGNPEHANALRALTVARLKDILKSQHLDFPSQAKKPELLELALSHLPRASEVVRDTGRAAWRAARAAPEDEQEFCASMTLSGKTHVCTFSNLSSCDAVTKTVDALVRDADSEDEQFLRGQVEIVRTKHREFYNHYMDLVDECDKVVMGTLPKFKQPHWTGQMVLYLLTVFICQNARIFFMSATGHTGAPLPYSKWVEWVYEALKPECNWKQRGSDKDLRCRVCYFNSARVQTRSRCSKCGPVCRNCAADTERHARFAAASAPYSVG